MTSLIGRIEEQAVMQQLLHSGKAEFVAVYGRRRIGKTYLINSVYEKNLIFYHTAKSNSGIAVQLDNWHQSMLEYGGPSTAAITWAEAFRQLRQLITKSKKSKKVVFIDEIPWLDTTNSDFLPSLEHFWNSWCSRQKNVVLIVCGSASSWIINKLINNHGGLHNRVTHSINLQPFTLQECKAYFKMRKANYVNAQIIEAYMAVGGIPFYLDQFNTSHTVTRNINDLFFKQGSMLSREFNNLYASLFKRPEKYIAIILALAKKKKGLTRNELVHAAGISNGGTTTKMLTELEEACFIRTYNSIGNKHKLQLYQLIDSYTLFYLHFLQHKTKHNSKYWLQTINTTVQNAWAGYAFEMVCLQHIDSIKRALGIDGILTNTGAWIGNNAQIDLVIDRSDKAISIVEIKYYKTKFALTKAQAASIQAKAEALKQHTKTNKAISLCLLTANGLQENAHSYILQHYFDASIFFNN
jgi:uncharacterized protein